MTMEPTLQHVLDSSLRWIFVGGKGGVGKTTTSCALATLFATTPFVDKTGQTRRRKILLVSTDPAHNLSDAFNQKLGKTPTPVIGLEENLCAMEIDSSRLVGGDVSFNAPPSFETSTANINKDTNSEDGSGKNSATDIGSLFTSIKAILSKAAVSVPGFDELAVFTEILRGVEEASFDLVILDTAPTGHTLHLLAMPQTVNEVVDKLSQLESLGPLLEMGVNMVSAFGGSLFGNNNNNNNMNNKGGNINSGAGTGNDNSSSSSSSSPFADFSLEVIREKIAMWHGQVKRVQELFNDHTHTSFICVCIPEFLSVYETERLVQELMKYNIACDSIVVNQLVMKPSSEPPCRMCNARQKIQHKYLEQIDDLYEDFHVIKMPLLDSEVRGVKALEQFAQFLIEPYKPDVHGYIELTPCETLLK